MSAFVNDRDILLQAAAQRNINPTLGKALLLSSSTPVFKVTAGTGSPTSATLTAKLVGLKVAADWSITGGALTGSTANERMLAFADMTAETAVITATVTEGGATYTASTQITKLTEGAEGEPGADGAKSANVFLYKWAPAAPAAPAGTSTFTWATATNSDYTGVDGWSVAVPANPGTPLLRLYVAAIGLSVSAATVSSPVSYAAAAIAAWTQNGSNGANGIHSGTAIVYKWAATIPVGPVGAPSYTWASNSFGAAPAGWLLDAGAGSAGFTLWAAKVPLVDSAANPTTAFNWSAATISVAGYVGGSGIDGLSYVTAYCASATTSTTTAPAATAGKDSVPAANDGGIVGTYEKTVPVLTSGQFMYQVDGIYNPTTDQVTWSIPYWSSLKVGSLSAIVVNTGDLTVTGTISSANGNFSVDSTGSAVMKAITIRSASGEIILSSGSTLNPAYAAIGTLNSAVTLNANGTLSGGGGGGVTIGGLGYAGDMNATRNIGAFATLAGTITAANAASYFAANSLSGTYIANLAADKITAGTMSADRINGGTITGTNINIGSGNFVVNSSNGFVQAYGFNGSNSTFSNGPNPGLPAADGIGHSFASIETFRAISSSSNLGAHGMRGKNTSFGTSALVGMAGAYDFYADGSGTNYGPFTGAHDALALNGAPLQLGDLVIDVACVAARGYSNTVFSVERSSVPNQRGVRGVVAYIGGPLAGAAPAAMIDGRTESTDSDGRSVTMDIMCGSYYSMGETHTLIAMNGVGEGQIKVCGEGGPIGPDDLLVTSSMPGVAMRQADDIIRGYTAAKARVNQGETVTFADAAEMKILPCIYLCGG